MNIWTWIILAWLLVTGLTMVAKVGKPRKPLTAFEAVCAMIEVILVGVAVMLAVSA